MERSNKPRKGAAAIYIPPSLRSKTQDMDEETKSNENANNSSEIVTKEENSSSPLSVPDKCTAQNEEKKPRGRGRGRRKPEIQVYVPRAMRGGNQQSSNEAIETSGQPKPDSCPMETTEARSHSPGNFEDNVDCAHNSFIGDEKNEQLYEESVVMTDESNVTSESYHSTPNDNPDISVVSSISLPVGIDSDNNLSNNTATTIEQGDSSADLTFQFYDPAVIAFLPSPKPSQESIVRNKSFPENQNTQENQEILQIQSVTSESENGKVENQVLESSNDLPVWPSVNKEITDESHKEEVEEVSLQHDTPTAEKEQGLDQQCDLQESPKDSAQAKKDSSLENKSKVKKTKKAKAAKDTSGVKAKELKSTTKKSSMSNKDKEELNSEKKARQDTDGAGEDSWDALFDEDGDCLDESLMADITAHVGKVEIDKPKIDYLSYVPKESDVNYEEFSHIVEIYDFPPEFGTHDIIGAFRDFLSKGFDIKWVDDTHALGIFSSSISANEALKMVYPMVKLRPMSQASKQGLSKARSCREFLQPYKARPETTSMAARRLVAGALGMAPRVSKEMREQERSKMKAAKEKRKQEKQQKVDVWDGNFGKCAMDGFD